jgi:hypothetical protein
MPRPNRRYALGLAFALLFASAARAAEPVAPASTDWRGDGTFKGKLAGAGSTAGPVEIAVDFGPNGGLGLAAGEFRISVTDEAMETFAFEGTFTVDAKGQPVLTPDPTETALELRDLTVHVCESVLLLGPECGFLALLDVAVDPTKLKLKVKTSFGNGDGATLSLAGKLPFVLSNGVDELRATFSVKTSPPAELVK